MHPPTVVAVLALHLVCTGGLTYLIGRRMPRGSGMRQWGVGCVLFGLAYGGRLAVGLEAWSPWSVLLDTAMIGAAQLFTVGLWYFLGDPVKRGHWLVAWVLVFAAADVAAAVKFGAHGRHVWLNLALALQYAVLTAITVRGALRETGGARSARVPMWVLACLVGGLSAMTMGRAGVIAIDGPSFIYSGVFAQVYYAYASLAAVLLAVSLLWLVFVRLTSQLAELATHDPLTRTLNRNGLEEVMLRYFGARDHGPMVILQVDIDHFKRINDTWGHPVGDAALCAVAHRLVADTRGNDFVARVGGEEFLVGCAHSDASLALGLAQRLRTSIEQLDFDAPDGSKVRLTISVGVSEPFHRMQDWPAAAQAADRALYAAKSAGRNRVVTA